METQKNPGFCGGLILTHTRMNLGLVVVFVLVNLLSDHFKGFANGPVGLAAGLREGSWGCERDE